jgi:hypothetical protein
MRNELPHHERLEEKKLYAVISSGDVAAVDDPDPRSIESVRLLI